MADAGEFGTILHMEAHWSHDRWLNMAADNWRGSKEEAPAAGWTGMGVHLSDMMLSLVQPVVEVQAHTAKRILAIPTGDVVSVHLRFADGTTGHIAAVSATPDYARFAVFGSHAWAEARETQHVDPGGTTNFYVRRRGDAQQTRRDFEPASPVQGRLRALGRCRRRPGRIPLQQRGAPGQRGHPRGGGPLGGERKARTGGSVQLIVGPGARPAGRVAGAAARETEEEHMAKVRVGVAGIRRHRAASGRRRGPPGGHGTGRRGRRGPHPGRAGPQGAGHALQDVRRRPRRRGAPDRGRDPGLRVVRRPAGQRGHHARLGPGRGRDQEQGALRRRRAQGGLPGRGEVRGGGRLLPRLRQLRQGRRQGLPEADLLQHHRPHPRRGRPRQGVRRQQGGDHHHPPGRRPRGHPPRAGGHACRSSRSPTTRPRT